MSHHLTEGALSRIVAQEEEVKDALVQVLPYRKLIVKKDDRERFCLELSDGKYSSRYCALAFKHNGRLHNKELERFTILKLTKVECIYARHVNELYICVFEFEVIAPGAQVGQLIGNPVPLSCDGSVPNNQSPNPSAGAAINQISITNPNSGAAGRGSADGPPPTRVSPAGASYQPQQRSLLPSRQDDIEKIEAVEATFREACELREHEMKVQIAGTEQLLEEMQNRLEKVKQQLEQQKQQLEQQKARSGADLAEIQNRKESLKTMMKQQVVDGNDSLRNLVPECPVCYERMNPPMQIYTCGNGHVICSVCKEKVKETGNNMCINCCGAVYTGRATAMEQMIRQILGNM